MSGTPRGKQSATAIPQTPAKEPKNWENMEVDSDNGLMEEDAQGTENVEMSDNMGATGVDKEKAGFVKKNNASFKVAEREKNLVELVINFDAYLISIPEVIDGIVLALGYLAKSKPNNALKLEKSHGGGLIDPTESGIPDNWGALSKYVRMITGTSTAMMRRAGSKGNTAHITIRLSSREEFTDNELVQLGIGICHKSEGKVSLVVKEFQVQELVAAFAIANAALMSRGKWNQHDVSEAL